MAMALGNFYVAVTYPVNQTLFLVNASAPESRQIFSQRSRPADPFKGRSHHVLNQLIEALEFFLSISKHCKYSSLALECQTSISGLDQIVGNKVLASLDVFDRLFQMRHVAGAVEGICFGPKRQAVYS